jgi:hypothetical protein
MDCGKKSSDSPEDCGCSGCDAGLWLDLAMLLGAPPTFGSDGLHADAHDDVLIGFGTDPDESGWRSSELSEAVLFHESGDWNAVYTHLDEPYHGWAQADMVVPARVWLAFRSIRPHSRDPSGKNTLSSRPSLHLRIPGAMAKSKQTACVVWHNDDHQKTSNLSQSGRYLNQYPTPAASEPDPVTLNYMSRHVGSDRAWSWTGTSQGGKELFYSRCGDGSYHYAMSYQGSAGPSFVFFRCDPSGDYIPSAHPDPCGNLPTAPIPDTDQTAFGGSC